jgi:hypothetical protein
VEERRNAYRVLVGDTEGKLHCENTGLNTVIITNLIFKK